MATVVHLRRLNPCCPKVKAAIAVTLTSGDAMERDPAAGVGESTTLGVDGPNEKKHGYTDQIFQHGPNLRELTIVHNVGSVPLSISVVLQCNATGNSRAIAVYNRLLARLDNGAATKVRKDAQVWHKKSKRLARKREANGSTNKENINDDIIDFQNDRKASLNNDESMEQEGTNEEILDDNFEPHLLEDTKQARETDQGWSLERGADDPGHEGFSNDSDQFPVEIDRDDAASQLGQSHVRGILGAANDVNGSLDQVGRQRELRSITKNRRSSAKGIVLDRSRTTTLQKKNRNIRLQNANARAQDTSLALTRRTLTRQHPSRPQSMLGKNVTRSQTKSKKGSCAKSGRH
ncbi:hypothetical protein BDR22DRAFT_885436 [Usnea florida]